MLTIKQKSAYGLGDFASNLVFQTVAGFMLVFYTDVFGLSAAVAGSIIGLVRLTDMLTDPIMGAIADRTRTRWGRYRPYLLFASFPFALLFLLAFTTPQWSDQTKVVYAIVTYSLMMLIYTIINIPYSALGGAMVEDSRERASLQSYRFAFAMIAGMLVVWLVPRLVDVLGGGDAQLGYQLTIGLFAVAALAAFLMCFVWTKEAPVDATAEKKQLKKDILTLLRNDQWAIIFGISFCILVMFSLRISVAPHYVKYYLGGNSSFLSNFLLYANIGALIAAFCTNYLSRRYEKRTLVLVAGVLLSAFGSLLSFVPEGEKTLATLCYVATQYCQNVVVIAMFSMVADSVDYGEHKTGDRIMAMTFSGHLLAIKFGFGVGGAVAGWALAYYGFEANQAQSTTSLKGMSLIFGVYPAVFSVLAVVLVSRYRLGRERVADIQAALRSRHREST